MDPVHMSSSPHGPGSLFEALHGPARSRSTDHAVLLPLLRQSGAALAYLHAMMVVHRDSWAVKPHVFVSSLEKTGGPISEACDELML